MMHELMYIITVSTELVISQMKDLMLDCSLVTTRYQLRLINNHN